jgi:cytochrome c oxidase subunit 2
MNPVFPFPENISTYGGSIDTLFNAVLWLTGITFVLVEIALVVFAFKYRNKPGRKATYIHGNDRLEVVWTSATAIIVIILALVSRPLWNRIKDPAEFPQPDLELNIVAKQFEWNVTYPGADGKLGTPDDFTRRGQLHMPVDKKILVTLNSEDVIHSFFLPNFRLKQDAVPGMKIRAWFEATKTGDYVIACAELCGLGHYRMKGKVTVHTADEFAKWQQEQQAAAAGAAPAAAETPAAPAAATPPAGAP